jgi:uncharacterized RmlC-like cupin family protein
MDKLQNIHNRWGKKINEILIDVNGEKVYIPISMTDIQTVLDSMSTQDYIDVIIESLIQCDSDIQDRVIMLLKEIR